ncbi:hypothetical protein G7Z17_g9262 [Cylindrodendrum hubeiense]|uniref:Uncharacterized protein n=1 Tax=Cylindrodendrum hubeiense TaxID=595255 RepID=A0A9P5LDV5_9HYPO|nr:hypothetical protein G7Z17_g9262 [Cylindrodendrum hubeiense]
MSGFEVFGAVAAAIGLIQGVTSNLGKARKVGKEVKYLRSILSQLMTFEDDIDTEADREELYDIRDLVQQATTLIENNRRPNRLAMRFFWTNTLDDDVKDITRGLEDVDRRLRNKRERILKDANKDLIHIDDDPVHKPLELERLSLLECDHTSQKRTLMYESFDHSVIVTHEIQFGTIPSTNNKLDGNEVSFLEKQLLTVESDTQYTIYLVDPQYTFRDTASCNLFMNRVRERTLLGSFLAKEIIESNPSASTGGLLCFSPSVSRGLSLARRKIVRLWERENENTNPIITLTFHDRYKLSFTRSTNITSTIINTAKTSANVVKTCTSNSKKASRRLSMDTSV